MHTIILTSSLLLFPYHLFSKLLKISYCLSFITCIKNFLLNKSVIQKYQNTFLFILRKSIGCIPCNSNIQ